MFVISDLFLRHTVDEADQRKVHTPDCSSQDNSDEDDEATLREQLLKSLAVKRKAKVLIIIIIINKTLNTRTQVLCTLPARLKF